MFNPFRWWLDDLIEMISSGIKFVITLFVVLSFAALLVCGSAMALQAIFPSLNIY